MADLDDLYAQIPTSDIANRLGVDESEVNTAVQLLVPVLVGGLHRYTQNPDHASDIEFASHASSELLEIGMSAGQLGGAVGHDTIADIFGGNDTAQVAAALSGAGADNSDLLQKLLPILVPVVLAYIGKQMTQKKSAPTEEEASGGALGDVLGSILSEMSGSGNKSLGNVLGTALGSKAGNILGGLFGGKK
ncbi:MAG: DUF937 domain-containing protein [Mycobacterium sp.]